MTGYWIRHRFLYTIIICVVIGIIDVLLFALPYIHDKSEDYNTQSIYKKSDIDFIAPEPSNEQAASLEGKNGINKIFPFYMMKENVDVNNKTRSTTVLLSDRFINVDMTMYNKNRLIKKARSSFKNPILVDWQFCHDTSSDIGDTVSLNVAGSTVKYKIYAVYETNSLYEGGAILAEINNDQKNSIVKKSGNNGYSGMYISANDYEQCKKFLKQDYRPLGRLKGRSDFKNDDQYQIHYDAIMSSNYSNEITDFNAKRNAQSDNDVVIKLFIGIIVTSVILIAYNIFMSNRGCEKEYFRNQCIPKGKNVTSYYSDSFIAESVILVASFVIMLLIVVSKSSIYIPQEPFRYMVLMIPIAMVLIELVCLALNKAHILVMEKSYKSKRM